MASSPPADNLDDLLDSALDDFGKIDLGRPKRDELGSGSSSKDGEKQVEDPIKGLVGMVLPSLDKKKKGKLKAESSKGSHVNAALEQLAKQTREAVRGLESATGSTKSEEIVEDEMMEKFVKQFEELAGSQDMESIVETMMHQLLSKEILYEPMKEISEKYPKWLEEHRSTLSDEDYQRYYHQYQLIKDLIEVYKRQPENFEKIVDLMQKMQECGQPPNEIVQELAPDLDLATLGQQLSPEMESSQNCCVM